MMETSLSLIALEELTTQVVLPKKLPDKESEYSHEMKLLSLLYLAVEDVDGMQLLPTSCTKLLKFITEVHPLVNANMLSTELSGVQPGQMLGMYVHQQNCGLIVYRSSNSSATTASTNDYVVSTFPGRLEAKQIHDCDGDLQAQLKAVVIINRLFWFITVHLSYTIFESEMVNYVDFANQLCILSDMPPKEDTTTNYVSKWLITLLGNRASVMATDTEFPSITKKVRDEAIGSFQRSAYYMFGKVMLQLNLTIEFGKTIGRFVYKLVMLRYLTKICNLYNNEAYRFLNPDLVNHMLAKLARRIEKLEQNSSFKDFKMLHDRIVKEAKTTIAIIRKKIDRQIRLWEESDVRKARLAPLKFLNFKADVVQQVPQLRDYLKEREKKYEQMNYDGQINYTSYHRHRLHNRLKPNINVLEKLSSEIEINLFLTDYENWYLYGLTLNDAIHLDPTDIRTECLRYSYKAMSFYKGDHLGSSKMLLTLLKLLVILDMIATHKHPLLKVHRTGINPSIFDHLLLPQHLDMKIALELRTYFDERNANASRPALIEENSPSKNSFSVQYAIGDPQMQTIRQEIHKTAETKIKAKRLEWEQARQKVAEMRQRAEGMTCTGYYNERGYYRHISCSLCSLKSEIAGVKIDLYERPLPTTDDLQNAVVFELRIPIEIACLRDVLCETARFVSQKQCELRIHKNWTSYCEISVYNQSKCEKVYLGSSSRLTLSHHNRRLHVDNCFEQFIVKNGYNCVYHSSHQHLPTNTAAQSTEDLCTLSVENGSPYENLQWTLKSTNHTQNQVLTEQAQSSVALALAEYKNFGSLRADGHRLQLRKLYAMIETGALSFETKSVLALIMQTIWETGPVAECAAYNRESHEDFADPIFAEEMIKLLDKFMEQQKCNWKDPLKLLTTALIAVRIFELNADEPVADRIVQLLQKLREITVDWIAKIKIAIHQSHENHANEIQLRHKLIDVAIGGAATFFVHFKHKFCSKIFVGNSNNFSSLRMWMETTIVINNNIILNDVNLSLTSDHRMFLRLVRNVGIHVEAIMVQMIENNPSEVHDLVKQHWFQAKKAKFGRSYFVDSSQVLVVENDENHIVLDIITGDFKVNNQAIARLAQNISKTPLFVRVFGQFVFEVQPGKPNSYSTTQTYNNCNYDFCLTSMGSVIITERRENGTEYELVPQDILTTDIPFLLVENYSHWWNKNENVIEFRPKSFFDKRFALRSGVEYELCLKMRLLMHLKTKRQLLDVKSPTYLSVVKQLSRLECQNYIHVLMDSSEMVKIELIRMHLKFEIVKSKSEPVGYDIVSNEFNGMRVSLQQRNGTLFGLNHGLFLESIPDKCHSKLLILPNAEINCSNNNYHASVDIEINGKLCSTPFHTYHFDDFCHQLTSRASSYTAWFYLAYLHALTSHGAPEPFTSLTGTERSLQILQSSFVWSSAPYDQESFNMLEKISKLSPIRQYIKSIKEVDWPTSVSSHAANDAFIFITTKLLADSQRLRGLYFRSDTQQLKSKSNFHLNEKDYLRWLPFSPNLRLSNTFVEHKTLITEQSSFNECQIHLQNTRCVSTLYQETEYHVPNDFDLKLFLTFPPRLDGPAHINCTQNILSHRNKVTLVNLWISLYENARQHHFSREQFALTCSLLTHEGRNLNAILALQAVALNSHLFASISPPPILQYNVSDLNYNSNVIKEILRDHHYNPSNYDTFTPTMQQYYKSQTERNLNNLTSAISSMWPCDAVDSSKICTHTTTDIDIKPAVDIINNRLMSWNNNRKLLLFIDAVNSVLQLLNHANADILNLSKWSYIRPTPSNWGKFSINFESKLYEHIMEYGTEVELARKMYVTGIITDESESIMSSKMWWEIFLRITQPTNVQHFIDAHMYPRLVKSLVLPRLLSTHTNLHLKAIIGAFAITLAHEQRRRRISFYKQQPQMVAALDRETESELHSNWSPCEYPEWLLFQIEQDLSIRRVQIEIAKRMINPPSIGAQHSVMQLNMGEGKTAVIVPILASVLSDGMKVCQITVLKSLFATNLRSLRQCLGGMLNRRVYTFPCRRDMPISQHVNELVSIFEECKRHRGVILTLPEYQLSLQLQIYETAYKGQIGVAEQFLKTHKYINDNVRSILDESDAILHCKYQLVYTIGDQLPLDGGAARWIVIQALLKRVPFQMMKLYQKYGKEKIEFDTAYLKNKSIYGSETVSERSDIFTMCRILDESVYDALKEALIDDFIDGKINVIFSEVIIAAQAEIKQLLQEKDIDKKSFEKIISQFSAEKQQLLLTLSGLLRFEVLRLVMTKRWRVNYGVSLKGLRKMAIPFKAKDVAAELTEFGHPDVALCYTHLSYYYSGLTDAQLQQIFQLLETQQNPDEIYEQWIGSVPKELIDISIKSYSGVNINDAKQRDEILFPLLRYNMYVIDYWLANAVFSREAKTFEKKLTCTAWDLCTEDMKHTVSGFSGTNNTKNTLPLPIVQNDLPELEQTNESVRKTLLREENQAYENLSANVSGKAILEKLVSRKIPVLLDSGALMLELNNEQVAREWLKLVPSDIYDAGIYFDSDDILMTIDRNDIKCEFDCSVYRDKLDCCVVYLDDAHTRGTDLKFPLGRKAVVTLSGDITRDKTVQACMRMRLLGKGHSIAFWASFEADVRLREICQLGEENPTNEHVIKFICNNSERFEKENIVHWATAGFNYAKKLSAHKLHEISNVKKAMEKLSSQCFDNEFVTLSEMYGGKDIVSLSKIFLEKFYKLADIHMHPVINRFVWKIGYNIDSKINTHIPDVKRYTSLLDEEQEKELEHELEEERQIERPPPAKPATPNVDPDLMNLVRFGASTTSISFNRLKSSKSIVSVPMALQNTKVFESVKVDASAWADHIFATRDFIQVIEGTEYSWDFYLRPVWWIASVRDDSAKDKLILLSSYECNALLPIFRKSTKAVLYPYRPRISSFQSNLLRNERLCVTQMKEVNLIAVNDEVEINVIAGAQYFISDEEQQAYCQFMGLIPRPRSGLLKSAFENGLIKPNGFVPYEHRQYSIEISKCVGQCKFKQNPVAVAIQIIENHHEFMRAESHVASILQKGTKVDVDDC